MNDIVLSTFGFASVGRGHYEVLEELAPLLRQNPHIKMQLILSGNFLNEEGKNIVHDRIREITKTYELQRQVLLVPDFITDLEVLYRLWCSDVGFLYLDGHALSSSAAIRFFVSARLPLVVSPSSHFADVRRGIARTESFSLDEFCEEVWKLAHDKEAQLRLRQEHEYTYQAWNWPKFASKYLHIYKKALAG